MYKTALLNVFIVSVDYYTFWYYINKSKINTVRYSCETNNNIISRIIIVYLVASVSR